MMITMVNDGCGNENDVQFQTLLILVHMPAYNCLDTQEKALKIILTFLLDPPVRFEHL